MVPHQLESQPESFFQSTFTIVRQWDTRELRDLLLSSGSLRQSTEIPADPEAGQDGTKEKSSLLPTSSLLLEEMGGQLHAKWNHVGELRRLSSSWSAGSGSNMNSGGGGRDQGQIRRKFATVMPAVILAASLVGFLLIVAGWRSYSEMLLEEHMAPQAEGGWLLHTRGFVAGAANGTCGSLQERHLYYPKSTLVPAPALLQALREYESMHRRCVMGVSDWRDHFSRLESGLEDCKYLIWKEPGGGVGDRFVSMVAAFEYALLTNRALLVSTDQQMDELLCTPLEGSSLWLPDAFPMEDLDAAPHQGDYMARMAGTDKDKDMGVMRRKDIVAVFLQHWTSGPDFVFFCSQFQEAVKSVPWMSWEANQYVGPDLFLVPEFERRLLELFPDRAVTTHTVRFLLHPVNKVWNRIATVYRAYFNFATKRVGLEVNTFQEEYDAVVTQRVLDCAIGHNILPAGVADDHQQNPRRSKKNALDSAPVTLLFAASLDSGYFQDLKKVYTEQPTSDRSIVALHSESNQGEGSHPLTASEKAMVDIWLLSFTDDLLISFQSTSGYVAYALGGPKRAYYLNIHQGQWKDNKLPVCERAWSSNPCYHMPPVELTCAPGSNVDQVKNGKAVLPYLRPCQDSPRGVVVIPMV